MPKLSKMEIGDDDEEEDIDIAINKMELKTNEDELTFATVKPRSKRTKRENLMWVEKYRPERLEGIISHSNVLETISKLVSARRLPHLLLYGPPGTGKTTTILAAARELNGPSWQSMTLELNASDERGIGVIRDRIKTFASTQQIFATGFKLIILDEADAMTNAAQFALRRVIEKYTKNTRFCLICNYVNKIIPALQSRCTKFRFAPLERKDISERLNEISKNENVNITDDGIKSIVNLSNGDMRKCLNILQSCHTGYPIVNELNVHLCTGSPMPKDIHVILNCLLNNNFDESFNKINEIQMNKGLALNDILTSLHQLIIRCKLPNKVMCQLLSQLSDLEHRLTTSTNERIQLASLVGIFQIVRQKVFELSQQQNNSNSNSISN